MSQCVPSWDVDEFSSSSAQISGSPDIPRSYYEVAELTWENGQLALHGLGPPRVPSKPTPAAASPKYNAWDKPRAGGTLESIVNQATLVPQPQLKNGVNITGACSLDDAIPWLHRRLAASSAVNMDAMVPCANPKAAVTAGLPNYVVGSSTRVGSCSVATAANDEDPQSKRARVARVPVVGEWSGRDLSASASATFGRESQRVTVDTYGLGLTSTSFGSQDNTCCGQPETKTATVDENDSASHSRPQMEVHEEEKKREEGKSVSTKRSRAAAIHNQSERKRRDKINQRMKTLQKLVPNSSKTDKASMLDEVIEYLKQLQAQIQMMSRMNMQPMMMPMEMQQLQMSMMNPAAMNMGMGLGNVMDHMNSFNRANMGGLSPMFHPGLFMPMAHWDSSGDNRLQQSPASLMPDLMTATLLACQSQPITMEAYGRLAAMYQQLQQQPPASGSKS